MSDLLFTSHYLAKVVQELPQPQPFFLNSFFPQIQIENKEEIYFDIDSGRRNLAPFVSPVVAGKVVADLGYTTKVFTPAYIKDKRVFDQSKAFKRVAGEAIGGSLSPDQRLMLAIESATKNQLDSLTRRLEAMAVEALRTGTLTISGDQYPTQSINFGRDAALTVTLSGASAWGQTGIKPLELLETWSMLITEKSGSTATTIVMDTEAWKKFAASAEVVKLLDRFRGADQLNANVVGEGGRYMGTTGSFDIWVYAGWYDHPDTGARTPYLPANTVLVLGPDIEGTRCYGAIKDEAAGFQAMPYYTKSWLENDPAVRYLLMQSAPLIVPYRVNACLAATVA